MSSSQTSINAANGISTATSPNSVSDLSQAVRTMIRLAKKLSRSYHLIGADFTGGSRRLQPLIAFLSLPVQGLHCQEYR
jgi:hypothetical protein